MFSIDAHADDVRGWVLPSPDRFADSAIAAAARSAHAGHAARAQAALRRRMRTIERKFQTGFHGRSAAKRRAVLDAFTKGPRPTLVVLRDRFWFQADVYRLRAALEANRGQWRAAADALLALVHSGQAEADDLHRGRRVVEHVPDHPLLRALDVPAPH